MLTLRCLLPYEVANNCDGLPRPNTIEAGYFYSIQYVGIIEVRNRRVLTSAENTPHFKTCIKFGKEKLGKYWVILRFNDIVLGK